jgi:UDP-N-acetylmuramate dehydrogenase
MRTTLQIREQVPLAQLTTLGVGGPARFFAEAATVDAAREAVEWAAARAVPLFVLGGGSNLLVADSGFPGLVLKVALRGIERDGELFRAYAGEDWDAVVAQAVEARCAGIECLSGIPGTVGGTPVQNVGAYGQEVSETIVSVEALDLRTRKMATFSNPECGFAYRRSRFNTSDRGRYLIVRVSYRLAPKGEPKIEYRDLREYFAKVPSLAKAGPGWNTPALRDVRDAVRAIRRSKAMLLVEGDEDARSAGSFFKNPVVSGEEYARLQKLAETRGARIPSYPALQQSQKLPAAWLVEQAGFHKGYRRGPVGISRKHALAIVNRGGATAADVIALKNEIQAAVREQFGIELQPEPVFVGFEEFGN